MRSLCRRSIITMSTSASPRPMSWNTSTPSRSIAAGNRVRGATTRTRAPMMLRSAMFERATRLCRMSPQIATMSPSSRPLRRRIVSASSSAWVGCSWLPSPALMTAQSTFSDSSCTAPDSGWRTTSTSGCIAFKVIAVSIMVSPLTIELTATAMLITSAPSRLPATSNEVRVRVEFSKKQLMIVRPRSNARFFSAWRFNST